MKNYTKEEIDFLKINYPLYGGEYCSQELQRTKNSILSKTKRLNILLNSEIKNEIKKKNSLAWYDKIPDKSYNVGYEQFQEIKTPDIAYILGILWSDGSITQKNNHNDIILEILKNDLDEIKKIFERVGKWNFYYRKRKNRKEMGILKTSNRPLVNYLFSLDFNRKSFKSPDNLIEKIPNELKKYFFRGIIDGDGCFYNGKNTIFSVTSTVNQEWKYFENLFDELKVKSKIRKKEHKNKNGTISQSSIIEVVRIEDIIKIGKYIYNNYEIDKIGLSRKYKKYLDLKKRNQEIDADKNRKFHKKLTI